MKVFGNLNFQIILAILLAGIFSGTLFAERLPVKIYTSADGLGSGFVDNLMNDSRGFMWFCTRDGLSRFDGARFVTYQIGENDSPPGIERIYESKSGIYWITTNRGTYRFNPNDASQIDLTSSRLKAEFVSAERGQFFEDSKGNFWTTKPELSLVHEKDGKVVFERYGISLPPEINQNLSVHSIVESIDGSIWLNSNKGLIRLLPDKHIVHYSFGQVPNNGNTFLLVDKKGYVWFAPDNDLFVIKPEPAEFFTKAPPLTIKTLEVSSEIELVAEEPYQLPQKDSEIFQFVSKKSGSFIEKSFSKRSLETSDGTIWFSAENNLLEFANGTFHLHGEDEGLPTVMWRMAEDAAGNLWVAGFSGLARIDRHGMTSYTTRDGANSSRFFVINEAKNGKLYFSAFDFYLNLLNRNRLNPVRPQIPPESGFLWASRPAFLDSNNNWWFLTDNKLYYFAADSDFSDLKNKPPTKVYSTADGLKSNALFQIFEDSSGNIWVSTADPAPERTRLHRLNKGQDKFYAFSESDGLPNNKSFSSAVEDARGNIWFTFDQGGVARFNGERFDYWGGTDGFLDEDVLDIHLDKKGRLWIASSVEGLYRIDDTSAENPDFAQITTAEGLSSNHLRTITEDRFGRIYLGSARGVDRFSPDTGYVKHYSVNDGLAADFVVDSHRDINGNLWFATMSGISKLVPQSEEKSFAPRILIDRLWVAGERQPVSQIGSSEIEIGDLSANQNNLQVDFFGLDFRSGESLRYQYKLEGTNEDWSLPTGQNAVNFANLSSGNYRFLVRAVNSEGQVSEQPAVVSFRILKPVYLRWWFIALCLLLMSGIIYALFRYRLKKVREVQAALEALNQSRAERLAELQRVRARIATDLHDDIGSSLTQISLYSELARQHEREEGTAGDSLNMITNVANELVDTMSDIVWAINPKKDHLQDLTQRMRRFAANVLTAKDIDLDFKAPDSDKEIPLGANIRREVFLIFKETVNNIAKHSEASEARIRFSMRNNQLVISFEDNGKGFDQSEKPVEEGNADWKKFRGGNGLLNMRKRAAELGGDYEIRSEIGTGTIVMLTVPLDFST